MYIEAREAMDEKCVYLSRHNQTSEVAYIKESVVKTKEQT
jgi:hypothetical protein